MRAEQTHDPEQGDQDRHDAGRRAARRVRSGLRLVLPDRPGLSFGRLAREDDGTTLWVRNADTEITLPAEDTGLTRDGEESLHAYRAAIRGGNTRRQLAERRRLLARRKGKVVPDDDDAEVVPAPRELSRRFVRKTGDEGMVERTVPLVPAYAHLAQLCRERHLLRGQFIADYCRLLARNARLGRGVSRAELADLAAQEAYAWSVQWAYKLLRWAYIVFSEWALREFLKGRVFTEEEIAPLRIFVAEMRAKVPAD